MVERIPKYILLEQKIIGQLIKSGKKIRAEKLLKEVFFFLIQKKVSPAKTLFVAVFNCMPLLHLRRVRRKRKTFFVPFPLSSSTQIQIAIKSILKVMKNKENRRKNKSKVLCEEIIRASNGQSQTIQNVQDSYKQILQNRIYKHYRW